MQQPNLLLFLAGKASRILVRPFAECAAEAGGERDGGLAELVPHLVRHSQSAAPTLVRVFAEKVHLFFALGPGGCVHAEQAYRRARLPIGEEECADLAIDFSVDRSPTRNGVRAGDGGEI